MLFSFFNKKINSAIHGPITFLTIKGNKALRAGGVTHSGGEILPMWKSVFKKLQVNNYALHNCLVLGVGGGDVLRLLKKQYKNISITGIEIDPTMIEVARNDFGLVLNLKSKIIIADAIKWVDTNYKTVQFDCIICDLYIGALNPDKSRTKEYIMHLKTILPQKGILIYNAHFQENNEQEFEELMKILEKLFSNVKIVFSYPLNRVLLLKK